jgi:hypothetical protein
MKPKKRSVRFFNGSSASDSGLQTPRFRFVGNVKRTFTSAFAICGYANLCRTRREIASHAIGNAFPSLVGKWPKQRLQA